MQFNSDKRFWEGRKRNVPRQNFMTLSQMHVIVWSFGRWNQRIISVRTQKQSTTITTPWYLRTHIKRTCHTLAYDSRVMSRGVTLGRPKASNSSDTPETVLIIWLIKIWVIDIVVSFCREGVYVYRRRWHRNEINNVFFPTSNFYWILFLKSTDLQTKTLNITLTTPTKWCKLGEHMFTINISICVSKEI